MSQEFSIVGNLLLKVDGAEAGLNKLKNSLSKLEMPKGLENSFKKSFSSLDDIFARYRKQLEKGFDTKGDVSNITKIGKELDVELTKVSNHLTKLTGEKVDLKVDTVKVQQATKDLEKLLEEKRQLGQEALKINIDTSKDGINNIKTILQEFQRVVGDTKAGNAVGNALFHLDLGDLPKALNYLREAEANLSRIGDKKRKAFDDTGFTLEGALTKVITELTQTEGKFDGVISKEKTFKEALSNAQGEQLNVVNDILSKLAPNYEKAAAGAREAARASEDYAKSTLNMKNQMEQLQQSTQYFFSLRNMINLLKRGINEAIESVKELDAAMTETAVVTDFSVGDMWEKLPEYTKNANALGASVTDMYKATTLYYQQGLNTEQSMSIAAETMKMARIGGLEAADATDKMTAALRGFNMEINEASAQRVNDVYSNLAAKTASNTEELGTAMQRTASIAASAGMSFEGTAAFLAQAIETTREPAENLGTAMKTIVARFTELKKNPLEIAEVDGEEVSYNKVDTALQSIGVSLKDANGQFRDLDQVFLDISQRWNSLSQTQQRYIATIAAGSRQQSRFIAMMSNYDRTVQLMDYANNSAGASNEQFGKTMESLEAKLNKLKNAWQQFEMGIANNSFIKGAVDGLTGLLNITNTVIDKLSLGSGVVKSFLSVFAAFTGLKAVGRFANAAIGGLGGLVDPQKSFSAGFTNGFTGNRQAVNAAQAHAISDPIVRAIYDTSNREIQSERQQSQKTGVYSERDAFRTARRELLGYTKRGKEYSLSQLQNTLSGLSANNQSVLMRGNAGTAYNMTQGVLNKYYKQIGNDKAAKQVIKQAERSLNTARAKGEITWSQYFDAISDPMLMKKAIDKTRNTTGINAAETALDALNTNIKQAAGDKAFTEASQKIKQDIVSAYSEQGFDLNTIDQYLSNEKTQAYIKAEAEKARQAAMSNVKLDPSTKNGGWATALNTIGRVGTKASEAGMSLQAFASILTSSANPALQTFGSVLSTFGGLLTGLGMGVSGISSTFTAIAESGTMVSIFGGAAATATGWIFAAIAAIAALVAFVKKRNQDIRDDAEKVSTDFKEKSEKNQSNISNLKEWKEELAVLSKGVDKNGLNISLDSSDYQRYLEITQGIADINPEIIQGYNSQGHAIIDNNKALQETLALEQQHSAELAKNYTNPESWGKLLKARNLERVSMLSAIDDTKVDQSGNYGFIGEELKPRNQMRIEARRLALELKNASQFIDISDIIDLDALSNGSISAFNSFRQNFDVIKHRISLAMDDAGEEWSERSRNAIIEGLSGFSEASNELDTLVQPMYEMMSTYATSSIDFERMADPLKTGFQQVLKNIAEEGNYEDPAAMQAAVDQQLGIFSKFSKEYEGIEKDIIKAQREFADNQDEAAYQAAVNGIDGPIEKLKELKTEFQNVPGGDALADWVDNQIERIEKRTFDGTTSIAQAWDTLSDEVAAAEGAYDAFADSIKSDYSTAADSMKQIYETATAETDDMQLHLQGFGDKTAWRAAEELFGDVSGWDHNDLKKAFEDIEPLMQEGQAGVEGFVKKVLDSNTALEKLAKSSNGALELDDNGFFSKIDDTLDPDIWSKVAETLGISEQLLVSMIQKSKQFFSIDTSNYDQVRTALGNDTTTIKGSKTVTYTDNEGVEHKDAQVYYMTDDDLRDLMGSEEYNNTDKRTEKIDALRERGIETLPDITKTSIEQLGKTLREGFEFNQADQSAGIASLVDTFGAKYDSDSILKMAQAYFDKGEDDEEFNQQVLDAYDHFWENQDYPTLGPVQNIESLVAQIASSFNRDNIRNGNLNDEIKQSDDFKEAIFGKSGVDDSIANFFRKGLDESGNALTQESYGQNLAELNKIQAAGETYMNDLRAGMQQAAKEGNEAQARYYSDELTKTQTYLAALDKAVNEGIEKYKEGTKETPVSDDTSTSTNPTTGNPNPYDAAEEEVYSRNTERMKQWWNDFWSSGDNPNTSSSTSDNRLSVKDGGSGFQEESNETVSALNNASEGLTNAGNSLTGTADQFISAINVLTTAGESLNTAASNLTTAAAVIASNSENNNPANNSGTIPGIPQNAQPNQSSISGAIVIDNSAALSSLDEVYNKATETAEKINEGATFKVKVKDKGLAKAGKNAQKITKASGDKQINLTANPSGLEETQKLTKAVKAFKAQDDDSVNLTTNLNGASTTSIYNIITAINDFHKKTDHEVNLTTNYKTTGKKPTNADDEGATGFRNHGSSPAPSFGSAAGGYGQVGPKGKGGLTLTGELGYEIAWIPSENRSMILGANGPQMVNLPGDAVVWTHEQSKKILKQKSIPAGSNGNGTDGTVSIKDPFGIVTKVKGSKGTKEPQGKKKEDKHKKDTDKQNKKNADNAAKVIKKAGNINAWWWNMGKKVEATQRIIDKTYKQIEKLIKKAGTTIDDLSEDGDLYIKKLNQQISLNTKMRNKANDKLTILDNGPSKASKEAKAIKKAQDRVDKAEKKVKKAKTAKEKAAAKEELKKAKKNLKKKQKTANYSTISYDVTTVKKDKKGKKTKSKKTKKQKVDLSKFIKYDEATEAYIIDYKKINSKNWDKSKKKAVMDAAQKKIEDYQKKRDTAEDNIDKAQEALEKFGAELYENFNAWENELTQIYFITKKIEETEKRISAAKTAQTLQENRLKSGLEDLSESFKQLSYKYFQVETHGSVRNINDRNSQISIQKQNTYDILQGNDLKAQRTALYRQLASATSATDKARINAGIEELDRELKIIGQARQYMRPIVNSDGTIELNFDTEAFEASRSGSDTNTETAQIIQKYVQKLQDANGELLDLYEEQISSLNELYETLISLQEQYLDYSNQLLEAIEKEAEDRVNVIKSLSDSISNSFKELIDEVKEQLDQRRQEEDNAKTERDIAKKQNRLALLRANASGGNVVAAAQLEQEIAEAQQSYGRTLEDQLLNRLQNSNDKAEKQREAQIKLLEAQLELNKINGVNTKHVADLMDHPELYQSEITRLIKYSEDYNRQTREGQESIDRKVQGILEGLDLQTGIPAKILDVKNEIRDAERSLEKTLKNYLDAAQKEAGLGNFNDAGAELAEELKKLSKQRDELQQKLNDLNTKKETLQSQLSAARSDSSKKYNALQDAEHRMNSAHSQLNAARQSGNQQRINAAETRVSQATQEYNTAYAAWTEANKKEKTLQVQLNNIETQIKSVQAQLNTVNAQYNKTDQEYATTTGQAAPFDPGLTEEDKANLAKSNKNDAEQAYSDYLLARKKAKSLSTAQINTLFDKGKAAGRTKKRVILDIISKDSFTGLDPFTWKNIIKELINANGISRWNLAKTWPDSEYLADALLLLSDKNYPNKMAKIKKHEKYKSATTLDHYKQGGLADYTGPAWLDGTPSKPELVLNSTDTKNLIALKDVLSKVMKGSLTTTTENQGDILYEININVDKIEKDYDVDQVVDKVKKEIVKSAGYRNVTQVRNFR